MRFQTFDRVGDLSYPPQKINPAQPQVKNKTNKLFDNSKLR
jgi:hypothetical protein